MPNLVYTEPAEESTMGTTPLSPAGPPPDLLSTPIPCPPDYDPEVWASLPPELQRELSAVAGGGVVGLAGAGGTGSAERMAVQAATEQMFQGPGDQKHKNSRRKEPSSIIPETRGTPVQSKTMSSTPDDEETRIRRACATRPAASLPPPSIL